MESNQREQILKLAGVTVGRLRRLELVKNTLIKDRNYVDRLKRHYNMFKAEIDRK